MKPLIAAACVANIAFVAYFFWGEYQAREEQKRRDRVASVQACVETLLKYQKFRRDGGPLPKNTGPASLQFKASECATLVNEFRESKLTVDATGLHVN
ncbi:hypothetical protein [Mesorhizobium sp. IMUNJ 23232]|uniref:hypothetical protein n=1 Tax=Mesorhizobium sp. IMUNJ 23232 TaxID=3376064 RepID=UPI0037B94A9F